MKPTEVLREEHELVLQMLDIMNKVCERLEADEKVDSGHMESVVDFIRGFADKCHHAKEEGILFPAMEAAGIPREGGPIGVMLSEHAMGRKFAAGMDDASSRYRAGERDSPLLFIENALNYISLLTGHIAKENNVLFPMADAHLSEANQADIAREFGRAEKEETGEGVHEKYHQLLDILKDEYMK